MHGRWRAFRHEAGQVSGPPPWVYVALFAVCLAIGIWSARTFDAVVIWPANGVMLAAYLQLHRRQALTVLGACVVLNLLGNVVRGDGMPYLFMNAALNLGQVVLAGLVARRVCGASLDLRRPRRLINFALMAVAPAVLLSAVTAVSVAWMLHRFDLTTYLFTLHRFFDMELLGLLIVTPALLLLVKAHRYGSRAVGSRRRGALLLGTLALVTTAVFAQSFLPVLFLIFPFLVLISARMSAVWVAAAVMLVAAIGGVATVTGHGPVTLMHLLPVPGFDAFPVVMRQLSIYYLFLLAMVITALPLSALTSERRRLVKRLAARTQAAQAARRRAEAADAAKSRFLALMSHEMRTPLNSVIGYAELLQPHARADATARRHLEQIERSGQAMLGLIEDVLELSDDAGDPAPVRLEPIDLSAIIETAAAASRPVAEAKGLPILIEVRPDAASPVLADARRLTQALLHLINNAVKFTSAGEVRILADRIDGEVLIAVSDSGCGLDPDRAAALFDPFTQDDDSIRRRHVGAGLGLSLVRRHVRLMQGEVVVRGRPGQGATFTLRLPLAAAPATIADAPVAATPDTERAPRVLVVDDHPANREVARLMVSAVGCDVVEAEDGDEAVAQVQAQAFDLILMDVRMPRMDGLTATRAIRALSGPAAATPILAVTADAMPQDAQRCLEAGMNAHLAKPLSHAALYAAMERLLANAPEGESDAA